MRGMHTYHVALSLTRPSNFSDNELFDLLTQAVDKSMCTAYEVTPWSLVVECDAAALELLEGALGATLEAAGGSLTSMTVTRL
jgi:hypothetical protein